MPHARLHPAPPTPFPRSSKGGYASGGGAGACDKDVLARWFLTEEGLSTNKIGMWLGGANDLNKETLRHFASLLSFRGRSLDGALRYFLSLFKLPGEAQQIDRVMQVVLPLPTPSSPRARPRALTPPPPSRTMSLPLLSRTGRPHVLTPPLSSPSRFRRMPTRGRRPTRKRRSRPTRRTSSPSR